MEYFRNIYPHVEEVNELIQKNNKIILFDTETTGLEDDANIIQFSAVLYEKRKLTNNKIKFIELENLDLYINPKRKLDPEITNLTGITDDMLKDADTEDKAITTIATFMKKADLWGAYNAEFDLKKIENCCKRTNTPTFEKDTIDVFFMAKNIIHKADIKDHKLGTVVNYVKPNYEAKFHDSLEDVRATGVVLEELYDIYKDIETPKFPDKKIKISSVSYWKNPNMGSMRRLTIWSSQFAKRNTGIFWDCKNKCFSCKADKASKELFRSINLSDLESQILSQYGKKYDVKNMDDLSRVMEREWNDKQKEKQISESDHQPEIIEYDCADDGIELL